MAAEGAKGQLGSAGLCRGRHRVCISVSPGSPGWGWGWGWALLGLRSRTEDTGDGAYFKSSTWPDGVNKGFRMPNMSPGGYRCSLIKILAAAGGGYH